MVVHKRQKSSRMRGAKTTHGFGAKKKHRGSGNRGGFGMAGSGKRADQKKPTIFKLYGSSYFGKHGFTSHTTIKVKAINVGML
ncbi:MAG: 50S ribosomal protein L15, partial [archaeon]|nr:50S ribosomal protein L15 [archaeon]